MASIDISNVVDQQGLVDKICSTVIDQQNKYKSEMVKNKKDNKSDNNEQIEVKNLLLEIKATMDNLGSIVAVAATTAVTETIKAILPTLKDQIKKELEPEYQERYKNLAFYCQDRAIESKIKIDDLECYNRRENIRFFNVKEEEGEKKDSSITKKKMLDLFEKMEIDIDDKAISDCHRIWPNPNSNSNRKFPPVVIMRFVSRQSIDLIFQNKDKLTDNIFATEDLSPLKMKLVSFLKYKVEDVQTSSVHTRRGRILCKRKSREGWFYLNDALDLRNVGINNWDLDQLGLDDCSLPRLNYE